MPKSVCREASKSFIYLSLRYSTKEIGKRIVIAVSKFLSGPFYRFEEPDQDPASHKLFTKQIYSARFKYLNNLKCELNCEQQKIYFDENGDFQFNNKLLQRVKPGDKDFTLVGQQIACKGSRQVRHVDKPPETLVAINSRGNEVLKQRCIPVNLRHSTIASLKEKVKRSSRPCELDEQKEFLALHHTIHPNQQVIFERTRSGLRIAKDIRQVSFASYKRTAAQQQVRTKCRSFKAQDADLAEIDDLIQEDPDVLSVHQMYVLYVELKRAGLQRFDPIQADPAKWIHKFETLTAKYGAKSSDWLLTVVAYFLERTPLDYLKYLRAQSPAIDYATFREQFIRSFASCRALKIQEAFSYQFIDGDLVDYAKKKFDLIESVFPNFTALDKIRSVIAGMNRKSLIDYFSINMPQDKNAFITKATELTLGIPH